MARTHSPPHKGTALSKSPLSSFIFKHNGLGVQPPDPSGKGADAKRRGPNLRPRGQVLMH